MMEAESTPLPTEADSTTPPMDVETTPSMEAETTTPVEADTKPPMEAETTTPTMTRKKMAAASSKAETRKRLDDFKANKNAKGPKSSHRCDYCMNIVARGVSHKCCFSMLIVNLVAIVVGFGLYIAQRVSSELLKYIAEHERIPRGKPMFLATGNQFCLTMISV